MSIRNAHRNAARVMSPGDVNSTTPRRTCHEAGNELSSQSRTVPPSGSLATVKPVAGAGRLSLDEFVATTDYARTCAIRLITDPSPPKELGWLWNTCGNDIHKASKSFFCNTVG